MNSRAAEPESNCRFYEDRLHAYIELELDEATSAFVAAHLRICEHCRGAKEAHEADRLGLLVSIVDAPELPASFASKVTAAIRDRAARQLEERRLVSWRFVTGLAAGVVLGALVVAVALSLTQQTMFEVTPPLVDQPPTLVPADVVEPEERVVVKRITPVDTSSFSDGSAGTADIITDMAASIFVDDEDNPCDDIDNNGTVDASDLGFRVYQIFGLGQHQSAELVVALTAVEEDCLNRCFWRS